MDALEFKAGCILADVWQYELAARIGIAKTELSEMECGRVHPKPWVLQRILVVIKGVQIAKAA